MNLRHTEVFHANNPQAQAAAELFYFDLITAAVIFLTVATLVLFVSARFRQRPGPRSPTKPLPPGNSPPVLNSRIVSSTGFPLSLCVPE